MILGSSHRVTRNFGFLLGSEVIAQALGLVLSAYLARTLGPDGFGVWVFATAVIGYLIIAAEAGLDTWGIREVSTFPERLKPTLEAVMGARLPLLALATLALLVVAWGFVTTGDRRWALLLGLTSLLAFALQAQWTLRGLERMASVAVLNVTQRALLLVLVLWLVHSRHDAPRVMLWQGVSEILAALVCLAWIAPRVGVPIPRPDGLARRIAKESWPIGAGRALRGLLYTGNVAVLAFFWSDAIVGEYGAGYRIAGGVLMLGTLFGAAVFPSVARACASRGAEAADLVEASLRVLAALLLPIVVGGCLLAPSIIRVVFGQGYAAAVGPLRALLCAVLVAAISDSFRRTLHSMNRQRDELIAVAAATALAIPFNLALTPRLGVAGAASAMIAVELALLALLAWVTRRAGLRVRLPSSLSRPLAAAALMGAAILPLRHLPLAVTVAVGAAVYAGGLWLVGHPVGRDLRLLDVPAPGETRPPA